VLLRLNQGFLWEIKRVQEAVTNTGYKIIQSNKPTKAALVHPSNTDRQLLIPISFYGRRHSKETAGANVIKDISEFIGIDIKTGQMLQRNPPLDQQT
jgi:hypothetical protein